MAAIPFLPLATSEIMSPASNGNATRAVLAARAMSITPPSRPMIPVFAGLRADSEKVTSLNSVSLFEFKAFGRAHELCTDPCFPRRVARIGYDHIFGLRPGAMQIVGGNNRANCVVAPLHNHAGNLAQLFGVGEQRILG